MAGIRWLSPQRITDLENSPMSRIWVTSNSRWVSSRVWRALSPPHAVGNRVAILLCLRLSWTWEFQGQALAVLILSTSQQLENEPAPQPKHHATCSGPLTAAASESVACRTDSAHLGWAPLNGGGRSRCADCLSSLIFSVHGAEFTTDF